MGSRWRYIILPVLSAVIILSGCGGEERGNGDREKRAGRAVSGTAVSGSAVSGSAVSDSVVSGSAVSGVAVSGQEADPKLPCGNDRNIYEEGDGVLIQRRLDGTLVKTWKVKKLYNLLYVDDEYVYYSNSYYPDDDGDEEPCSDVYAIPIRTGGDGNDVLMTERTEKITGSLEGVVCRPFYIDGEYMICRLYDYEWGSDIIKLDRKKGKIKGMRRKDEEYDGYSSFAVVGGTLFSYVEDRLCSQKPASDEQQELGTDWQCEWSRTQFFYKEKQQYMMYDVEQEKTSLLNEEDLLQKIAQEEGVDRSCIYEDVTYGESLFYSRNKLYVQVIYNVDREGAPPMERKKCAMFSLEPGPGVRQWQYEREMSEVFEQKGKGLYAGMVYGKAFFVIWTDVNEELLYGSYNVSTGEVRMFDRDDAEYFQMYSDPSVLGTVEGETTPDEEERE